MNQNTLGPIHTFFSLTKTDSEIQLIEKQWCALRTQPRKEDYACLNLKKQKYEYYYPKIEKIVRHARSEKLALRPLFPGYVFVKLDRLRESWYKLNSTYGVAHVILNSLTPAAVPDEIIHLIQEKENNKGVVPLEVIRLFMTGDKVIIKDGSFAGQTAVFCDYTDNERVEILLSFLGREHKVKISALDLEKFH